MKNLKCIQKTVLTKLKIIFLIHIANKEKENINYEILSFKVDDINFYDSYNTLYSYLSKFDTTESSIKNKSFLEDLLKGFKRKSIYTNEDENNIEKANSDLVLNNEKIDHLFYKRLNNKLSIRKSNIF